MNGIEILKVDGSMEKKWDTAIPADLKRLFVSGAYIPLVTNRLTQVAYFSKTLLHLSLQESKATVLMSFQYNNRD
jgi:hypothetical protein